MLLESITYVGIALALNQMLYVWHIAKNVKGKVLAPQFHGNQDYITIKVISRRMFVLTRLQHIDEFCNEELLSKYLAFIIIDVGNNTSGLKRNQIEALLLEKEKFWIGTLSDATPGIKYYK